MPLTPPTSKLSTCLLFLLFAFTLIWFSALGYRKLVKPDEGRYAEIPRQMLVSGDWLTPRLNNIKYFEKPALQYWTTTIAYKIGGLNETSARIWPALTGFLGVLLSYFTCVRLFNRRVGLYAAGIQASSFLYFGMGHMLTLDMGVSFFLQLTLCSLLLAFHRDKNRSAWLALAWASMAGAMLSKGLIGVALPLFVLIGYSLVQRSLVFWTKLNFLSGVLIFTLLAAPWFILVAQHNPEFTHFFFIHEHFQRFSSTVHHRTGSWYYFIPILIGGLLPWSSLLMGGLYTGYRTPCSNPILNPTRVLLCWSVIIFAFFSVSGSKLPSYILPIFPALAILIALHIDKINPTRLSKHFLGMATVAMLLLIGVILAISNISVIDHLTQLKKNALLYSQYVNYANWLIVGLSVWLIGLFSASYLARCNKIPAAVLFTSFSSLLAIHLMTLGHNALNFTQSGYQLAEKSKPYLQKDTPFYSVNTYEQTLPFYLNRSVTLVHFQDEMEFGIEQEPNKWIPTVEEFIPRFQAEKGALALMSPDTYATLKSQLAMQIIAEDPKRMIVLSLGNQPIER